LGNNIVTLPSKSHKIYKDLKTISCNIWLNFNRGISSMLDNYSGPWRSWRTKELRRPRRPCRDSRNRSSSRPIITELRLSDHIMTLLWSTSSVPWLNLGNQTFSVTVENFIETSHWKLLISHNRQVCRGTQVGKHCVLLLINYNANQLTNFS